MASLTLAEKRELQRVHELEHGVAFRQRGCSLGGFLTSEFMVFMTSFQKERKVSQTALLPAGIMHPPPGSVWLRPRKALPLFSGHPWVYPSAVARVEGNPAPGDEVLVISAEGNPIGRGLFNPQSQLRVRLYSWDVQRPLDAAFWEERLVQALAWRRQLIPTDDEPRGCRLVFSEGDGLSGLVVDRFGDWLSVQITAVGMLRRWGQWQEMLIRHCRPRGIFLRTEKGMRQREGMELTDHLAWGTPPPSPLWIREGKAEFAVDLAEGQKTGFYLDQRDNRQRVAPWCVDRRVLDVFCYSGGFGIHASLQGAREVWGIDGSASAIQLATLNAERNGVSGRMRFLQEDAFRALEQLARERQRFDVVILDPPKMARQQTAVAAALRGYFSLNRLALDVLEPSGLLVTCSCSGVVGEQDFIDAVTRAGRDAGRTVQIVERRGAAPDHPYLTTCPESAYLKCLICRVW
ncbi:MAG: 23S rRNA methyltransferase [Planctomycetaceae bacterium]|nr:MAG: 23S rRNA methyltransferase [Planctomycetaceae bacterium]